jgi:hypothetical protein
MRGYNSIFQIEQVKLQLKFSLDPPGAWLRLVACMACTGGWEHYFLNNSHMHNK